MLILRKQEALKEEIAKTKRMQKLANKEINSGNMMSAQGFLKSRLHSEKRCLELALEIAKLHYAPSNHERFEVMFNVSTFHSLSIAFQKRTWKEIIVISKIDVSETK